MQEEENVGRMTLVRRKLFDIFEKFIYSIRILLIPFYLGLTICLVAYLYAMGREIGDLVTYVFSHPDAAKMGEEFVIRILSMVDITMIANLVVIILVGSYSIFIRKIGENHKKMPQWLEHLSSGSLKVKTTMSIVSVLMINLLKVSVQATDTWEAVAIKIAIFLACVLGMMATVRTNRIVETHHAPEAGTHPATHVPEKEKLS